MLALAALSGFGWAATTGALADAEATWYRVLDAEGEVEAAAPAIVRLRGESGRG